MCPVPRPMKILEISSFSLDSRKLLALTFLELSVQTVFLRLRFLMARLENAALTGAVVCKALSSSGDRSSSNPCPLLGSDVAAMTCTHYWSSCRQCPAACEHTEKEVLMVSLSLSLGMPQQWFLALLVGPSFFLDSPSCAILYPHPLKLSSGSQSQSSL